MWKGSLLSHKEEQGGSYGDSKIANCSLTLGWKWKPSSLLCRIRGGRVKQSIQVGEYQSVLLTRWTPENSRGMTNLGSLYKRLLKAKAHTCICSNSTRSQVGRRVTWWSNGGWVVVL